MFRAIINRKNIRRQASKAREKAAANVAVITGDGCMHMQGIEVVTAARYQLPIIYVVINNSALGNALCARASEPFKRKMICQHPFK